MKWLFILSLLANVLYLGWEIDRDARLARSDAAAVIRIPPGTPRLELLSELDAPPAERTDADSGANRHLLRLSAAGRLKLPCVAEIPKIPICWPNP